VPLSVHAQEKPKRLINDFIRLKTPSQRFNLGRHDVAMPSMKRCNRVGRLNLRNSEYHLPMEENSMAIQPDFQRFKLNEVARSFPDSAETLLLDTYLTDEASASSRVFRVYRETPPHYHAGSDEHLYVLSGKGTFWMGDISNGGEFAPGDFLFFKRGTVHALPDILEEPVVFLAIDAPRRDPRDIIFVNPQDGTPESFIRERK
jgi:mannose-6-phosphate isomerase-like protein (cupin superfamily)